MYIPCGKIHHTFKKILQLAQAEKIESISFTTCGAPDIFAKILYEVVCEYCEMHTCWSACNACILTVRCVLPDNDPVVVDAFVTALHQCHIKQCSLKDLCLSLLKKLIPIQHTQASTAPPPLTVINTILLSGFKENLAPSKTRLLQMLETPYGQILLFPLSPGSTEWSHVAQLFQQTMPQATLCSIQRIQNKWLWER